MCQSLLGKSTGKGALGIWVHNLKSITISDYESGHYKGPAVRVGAGVQGFEAFYAAQQRNLTIIGGTCPTVSIAGGFTQGAGHGMLISNHGLSADNALEWEVVTANGTVVTASTTQNADLYWALSGGGAGTYGVVVALTVKAFPNAPLGGASLAFASTGISQETFWNAVGSWHAHLPVIADNHGVTNYVINHLGFNATHITFPGRSKDDVTAILSPFIHSLKASKIEYSLNITTHATFVEHYDHYIGLPYGDDPSNQVTGSRLIPRSVILNNNTNLTAVLRTIISDTRYSVLGLGFNVASNATGTNSTSTNSVLPAWREAVAHLIITGLWNYTAPLSDNLQVEDKLTNEIIPLLHGVTPGSGTYLNEADFRLSDWKEAFYGRNYAALLATKQKYDPEELFYAATAVGSDAWTVAGDGRLCKAT